MSRALLLSAVVALLGPGCAARPKPVAAPPSAAPVPANREAPGEAPGAAADLSGELLDHVPARAVAALVVRPAALAMPRRWLGATAGMRAELSKLFIKRVGVDLTGVRGLVLFASRLTPPSAAPGAGPPAFAALALLEPDAARGARLTLARAGDHRGVALHRLDTRLLAALTKDGLLIGTRDGIEEAIDLAQQRAPALSQRSRLGELLAADSRKTLLLGGLHLPSTPELAAKATQLGMEAAALTVDVDRLITLRVAGDARRMQTASQLVKGALAMVLVGLEHRMRRAVQHGGLAQATGAIVGYHQARAMIDELEPALVGDRLVSRYRMPTLQGGTAMVAYGGILAAIAIPAFVRYLRKAKTVEATSGLQRIRSGLAAHLARGGRLPATTRWTPATPCCVSSGPGKRSKCPGGAPGFDHPSWKAVGFRMTGPHHYQYRLVTDRRAKRATIEARGDLDCDGKFSSYRIEVERTGRSTGPVVTDELE